MAMREHLAAGHEFTVREEIWRAEALGRLEFTTEALFPISAVPYVKQAAWALGWELVGGESQWPSYHLTFHRSE